MESRMRLKHYFRTKPKTERREPLDAAPIGRPTERSGLSLDYDRAREADS